MHTKKARWISFEDGVIMLWHKGTYTWFLRMWFFTGRSWGQNIFPLPRYKILGFHLHSVELSSFQCCFTQISLGFLSTLQFSLHWLIGGPLPWKPFFARPHTASPTWPPQCAATEFDWLQNFYWQLSEQILQLNKPDHLITMTLTTWRHMTSAMFSKYWLKEIWWRKGFLDPSSAY